MSTDTQAVETEQLAEVRRAAAYLDAKYGQGQWEPLVNLKELAQDNADRCVAGQIAQELGQGGDPFTSSWRRHAEEFARLTGQDAHKESVIDHGPFGGYTTGEWMTVLRERGYTLPDPVMVAGVVKVNSETQIDRVGDILTILDDQGDVVKIDLSLVT